LQLRERTFELAGLTLAAREWGEAGHTPVLALHGWLDNAGSFDLLAERLEGCHVVALDLPGHGLSDSRAADAAYNIWQEVGPVCEVAEHLGWSRYCLLGHSRGAAVACLVAGTFPALVDKVVLIEGGVPLVGEAAEAPQNLASSLAENRRLRDKSGRVFADLQTALEQRAQGFSPVEIGTAEILARRSLRQVPGGYQWHADQRLKAKSELRLTDAHARAFLGGIAAPVMLFLAERSPFCHSPPFQHALSYFRSLQVLALPGGHHLHLEGAEAEIAARTRTFLGLAPQ
jgi:pimeloyl-ACP methyl ester carboxylesterase